MENFEKALQSELDKLPYEPHVDDGMYNDGKQAGFELGARWALEYIRGTLPTGDKIDEYSEFITSTKAEAAFVRAGAAYVKHIIKSRLAGKEE